MPSFTRVPARRPSHVQSWAPVATSGRRREPTSEPSLRRTLSFIEPIRTVFVQRSRSPSSTRSPLGENARAAAFAVPVPTAVAVPGAPKLSPLIPALTIVALGAVAATTYRLEPFATAIQTPCSANDTVDHSRIGSVTSYQV